MPFSKIHRHREGRFRVLPPCALVSINLPSSNGVTIHRGRVSDILSDRDGFMIGLFELLQVAMRALARNKMRSLLTMLGIIIGVGAVICSVAIGEGASNQIQEQ